MAFEGYRPSSKLGGNHLRDKLLIHCSLVGTGGLASGMDRVSKRYETRFHPFPFQPFPQKGSFVSTCLTYQMSGHPSPMARTLRSGCDESYGQRKRSMCPSLMGICGVAWPRSGNTGAVHSHITPGVQAKEGSVDSGYPGIHEERSWKNRI